MPRSVAFSCANLRLHHAGRRDGRHKAPGHDLVAEPIREIRTVEEARAVNLLESLTAAAEIPESEAAGHGGNTRLTGHRDDTKMGALLLWGGRLNP